MRVLGQRITPILGQRVTPLRLYQASQIFLLAGAGTAAVLTSRAGDWHPLTVVIVLGVLAVAAETLTVQIGNVALSPSFIAAVLAMVFLGPAPAAAMTVAAGLVDGLRRRMQPLPWLTNLATFASYAVAGGLIARLLMSTAGQLTSPGPKHPVAVALVASGVYVATNLLNFALISVHYRVTSGRSIAFQIRNLFLPMLPSEVAALVLTAVVASVYASTRQGSVVVVGLAVAVALFAMLVHALARSERRADELATRSSQLAHLQVGVLSTLLETLALRDPATARHGASVARLARTLAKERSLSERDQELVYTAGLLHDIGKFALPDRILWAAELTEEDLALVKRHSQDGAALVGRLDGYGPVAEIILYHHERIDGTGYPAGLIGREIPLLARVIAVCETYDALTGRDSYRRAMTPAEAFAEMRTVAGRQLDADLVDDLIVMLQRDGAELLARGELQRSEAEVAFTRLAHAMAQPTER
jgi:putative nucleotidyltransferase with HDIG domain